ncbi:MAG: hypothetical protein AAF959_11990 [Cyanobacteria bacterium P01_D01_bin.56]
MKASVRDSVYHHLQSKMPKNFTGSLSDMILTVLAQMDTQEKLLTQLQPAVRQRQPYQVVSVLAPVQDTKSA